jgi:hypothetical protein
VGPAGRKLGHWGFLIEGDIGILALSFLFMIPRCHKVISFAPLCVSCHDILLYHRPKAMEPADHGLKLLKPK